MMENEIPTCNILGVEIAAIDMDWLLRFTESHLRELSGNYMCVANVHTTVTAHDNAEYRAIQNGAALAIPDGAPLSAAGRNRGHENMQRTTGPGYMGEIFAVSPQRGYRHYFYGGTEDTLAALKSRLEERYPRLQIAGMYSPPFRSLTEQEDGEDIERINAADADFVWVGLGAPKQERWMAAHKDRIKGFMVGVGAGFDYYAGKLKRAPQWMQRCSLEWLYRLLQDPKRLLRRYLVTNIRYLYLIAKENRLAEKCDQNGEK